ncbi:MAG TPA: nucleotidyltransferase domain-containing protein, partial [Umezawaea sp.]|nr:nucleotidyltransferase domain-containing protein [Umezawaea sp.]
RCLTSPSFPAKSLVPERSPPFPSRARRSRAESTVPERPRLVFGGTTGARSSSTAPKSGGAADHDDRVDAVTAARDFVVTRFPEALAAVLSGSASTGRRTPLSDLDVVVIIGGPPAPFRETTGHGGWVVELFCNTVESFTTFVERETAVRRSPLLHMVAEGVPLLDRDGVGQRIRQDAATRLRAGPPPLSATELEDRRYVVTDLLDDLEGSSDHAESIFIATRLLTVVAELVLAVDQRWQARGKWLARRLRDADPQTCEDLVRGYRLLVAEGDAVVLHQVAATVLDRAGGRLLTGYRRGAPATGSPRP